MLTNQHILEHQKQLSGWQTILASFFSLCAAALASDIIIAAIFVRQATSSSETENLSSIINLLFAIGSIFLIGTTFFTFALGLPVFVLGWHFEFIRWWSGTLVGFLLGSGIGIIFRDSLTMGVAGAVGGFACWLTWIFLSKLFSILGKNKKYQD